MKRNLIKIFSLVGLAVLSIVILNINVSAQKNKKLTAGEVIEKHLQSIGTTEARAGIKSMMSIGTTKAVLRGRGTGYSEGIVVIASKDKKYLVGMKFNNNDYQFETMGYNDDDFSVGYATPGQRSVLGDFLRTNESTFKHGLLSGTLSTAWELLDVDNEEFRVKYGGMEKIDGKQVYELKFEPKKGSDMKISLFFDSDNFQHVRTEYRRVINANMGTTVDNSARQSEKRYKLVEEFSNFKVENNLTLPHTYKMEMEIIAGNGSTIYGWEMDLQQFSFNQPIDDKEFRVDSQ